jgi:hypothetical protein
MGLSRGILNNIAGQIQHPSHFPDYVFSIHVSVAALSFLPGILSNFNKGK